jgi:endonuclease/exonuclease/phosphatase family metal-dependent hydrolase
MKVLTCNIRCFGAKDGLNHWTHRRRLCADVIRAQAPDIVCFQEMWSQQFADLSAALPGYRWFGATDEPAGRHPQNCIFYRREGFERLAAGAYWLSKRPHVPGSRSWGSACIRLANWLRLEDRATGIEFRVVNTHLDHLSQEARDNQARLLAEDAAAYPPAYPQILAGDMNCDADNTAIGGLQAAGWSDTYSSIHGTGNPGPTYHEFLGPRFHSSVGKMDWIFVRGNLRTLGAEVITESREGRFPSDHYFVSATLELAGAALPGS